MTKASTKFSQYFAAIAAAVGAMAFGTGVAWSAPTGPKLIQGNEYGFEITDEQFSWVGSAMTLGAGCVCILTGYLINFIGRKTTMLLLVVPFTLGWTSIILAQNITTLIVGRALLGIASGGICVAAPMYTGEIAEKDIRGTLCSFFQLLITIGILFVYVVGAFVSAFCLSVICASIPLIFGLLVLFCPESPTYLMQKHKLANASEALIWLRGRNYDPTIELNEMQLIMDQQKHVSESIASAMLRRSSVKALCISFGLFICQQMCGINVVIFYTTDIF
ncbi:Facilitated trehalose transporter Tret1, partial [Pseudolycoriella hygida]